MTTWKKSLNFIAFVGAIIMAGISLKSIANEDRQGGVEAYSAVSDIIWGYYEAVANPGDGSALDTILDQEWNGKRQKDKTGVLAVEVKAEFIAYIVKEGGVPNSEMGASLTSVQVFYNDFAMARVDNRESADVKIFTLIKTGGHWRIISEVSSGASYGKRENHFTSKTATDEILEVMDIYYQAVEFGKPDDLRQIFDDDWHMKNPENGVVVSEDKETFVARAEAGPHPGYYDNRQVTDVQVLFDHMAIVRVDNPATRSTTMFTLMQLGETWKVIDKSWAYPPAG